MPTKLQVGRLVGTHGVRGELRLEPWLDSPDFLHSVTTLFLKEAPVRVTHMRPHKNLILLKLEGIDDIPAAQALRGEILWADRSALPPLPSGRFFIQDLIGMAVCEEETGAPVGTVQDVWKGPSQDVFVVCGPQERQILIPHVDAFVKTIDMDARRILVHLIEGM